MEIKNETLLNSKFSEAMARVCAIIWGGKTDEAVFKVLDAITERQNELSRLYKKYAKEAETSPEKDREVQVIWSELVSGVSDLDVPEKVVLQLGSGKDLSGMERFHLRQLFDIKEG